MSLLNQMLKDLEKRQAAAVDPAGLPGTGAGLDEPRRFTALLWILLAVALVLGAVLLWFRFDLWADRGAPTVVGQAESEKIPILVVSEGAAAVSLAETVSLDEPLLTPAPVPTAAATVAAVPPEETPVMVSVPEEKISPVAIRSAEPEENLVAGSLSEKTSPRSQEDAVLKTRRLSSPEEKAQSYFAQGAAALKAGQVAEAEQAWRQALQLDAAQRESRENLANLLAAAGRRAEAQSLYAAGLEIDPAHSPFRRGYARLLAERGELLVARDLLQQGPVPAVTVDPDYHALLAALSQRLGDYAAAAASYSLLVQHEPRSGVGWLGLGLALESDGRAPEAVQAYRQALASGTLGPELLSYVRGRLEVLAR